MIELPKHGKPFTARHERTWPRAGVRRKADGFWAMTVWAAPDVSIAYYVGVSFGSREEAVDLGRTIAGAHRSEGVIEAVS